MRILRSFPEPGKIPPGRAYVCDDLEKLYTPVNAGGCADFSALRDIDDDVILIEWDVAVDEISLRRFVSHAQGRDWPIVAPHYKITPDGQRILVHFRLRTDGSFCPVIWGDRECDQFAPGLAYFPRGLLRDCPSGDARCDVMNEGVISRYLRSRPDWRPVPIAWDITTTHLHGS
jgi:hypothetical protein